MGAHHDINMTPPRPFKPSLLTEHERCDFDLGYSGRMELTYTNNLSVTIYLADRQGAVVAVRPQNGVGKFCMRIARYFGKGTVANYQSDAFSRRIGKARPTPTDIAVRENYTVLEGAVMRVSKTKDLLVGITLEDLEEHDGAIYHAESDLVISLTVEKAVHHGSPLEVLRRCSSGSTFEEVELVGMNALANITIVANNGKVRDRFIRFAGEVHRIKPVICLSRADGIYVEREGRVAFDISRVESKVEHHLLTDEIEKSLGLFKTYDEALTWDADLQLASERDILRKKNELVAVKVDSEIVSLQRKDEFEDKGIKRKDKSDRRKDRYEETSSRRKDEYDHRSTRRKDTSDELKWILGMTAALFGAAALFRR